MFWGDKEAYCYFDSVLIGFVMNKFEFIGEVYRGVANRHGDNIVWRGVTSFSGSNEEIFDVLHGGTRKRVIMLCRDAKDENRSILTVHVEGFGKRYDFDSDDYSDSVDMIVNVIDDMIKKEV